jgi:hypothetical protein
MIPLLRLNLRYKLYIALAYGIKTVHGVHGHSILRGPSRTQGPGAAASRRPTQRAELDYLRAASSVSHDEYRDAESLFKSLSAEVSRAVSDA